MSESKFVEYQKYYTYARATIDDLRRMANLQPFDEAMDDVLKHIEQRSFEYAKDLFRDGDQRQGLQYRSTLWDKISALHDPQESQLDRIERLLVKIADKLGAQ